MSLLLAVHVAACLLASLFLCLSVSLVAIFYIPLYGYCLIKMSHCLPVFILPSACLYFYQPVLRVLILSEFVLVRLHCLSSLSVCWPFRLCLSVCPLALDCKVKIPKDTERIGSLVCMLNYEDLGRNIDSVIHKSAKRQTLVLLVTIRFSFCRCSSQIELLTYPTLC